MPMCIVPQPGGLRVAHCLGHISQGERGAEEGGKVRSGAPTACGERRLDLAGALPVCARGRRGAVIGLASNASSTGL